MIIDDINDTLGYTNIAKDYFSYANFKTKLFTIEAPEQDKVIATSYLGTPIFSSLEFEKVNYRDFNDVEHSFDGLAWDLCIMTASVENNIIETSIQGRNGVVMEMISNGNYKISVQGFLISQNENVAPYSLMEQFKELSKATTSIKINSAFLNALDIYEVVVNSASTSEVEGMRNLIAATLSLTSEIPIEVRLA